MKAKDPGIAAKELSERALEKSIADKTHLPKWPESKRGTPNSFLRSALFSAIQSKDRKYLKGVILASQQGLSVKFTGLQLNQEDLTLWETLVHLAKDEPVGTVCRFSAYEILKTLELGNGSKERERLHSGIIRLSSCIVEIHQEGSRFSYAYSLINSSIKDEITNHYTIELNKKLIGLYSQTTWIDWDQRALLRGKPLAQCLHGYYSSHKEPFPVKIETLQKISGSKSKDIYSFKQKLCFALDELVKIEFLKGYIIDNNTIIIKK